MALPRWQDGIHLPLPQVSKQAAIVLELLYHVKEDDSVIGPVDRVRAHAEGLLHRSGMTFLTRSDGKILIQYRNREKETYPDCYDSSSSFHVMFGESYEQTAKRELIEETGIDAPLEYLMKFTHDDPPEHEIVAVFACRSDESVVINLSESFAAIFCTKGEIDEIVKSKNPAPWLKVGWSLVRSRF